MSPDLDTFFGSSAEITNFGSIASGRAAGACERVVRDCRTRRLKDTDKRTERVE
jgi:hypothetical protein